MLDHSEELMEIGFHKSLKCFLSLRDYDTWQLYRSGIGNLTHLVLSLGFQYSAHTFQKKVLDGELLINEHKVSGKQDEYPLEICCRTL